MTEQKECPYSSVVPGFSELRRCKDWGSCGRACWSGDYAKCQSFGELENRAEKNE